MFRLYILHLAMASMNSTHTLYSNINVTPVYVYI